MRVQVAQTDRDASMGERGNSVHRKCLHLAQVSKQASSTVIVTLYLTAFGNQEKNHLYTAGALKPSMRQANCLPFSSACPRQKETYPPGNGRHHGQWSEHCHEDSSRTEWNCCHLQSIYPNLRKSPSGRHENHLNQQDGRLQT